MNRYYIIFLNLYIKKENLMNINKLYFNHDKFIYLYTYMHVSIYSRNTVVVKNRIIIFLKNHKIMLIKNNVWFCDILDKYMYLYM